VQLAPRDELFPPKGKFIAFIPLEVVKTFSLSLRSSKEKSVFTPGCDWRGDYSPLRDNFSHAGKHQPGGWVGLTLLKNGLFHNRVARWDIFKPKIAMWLNFGGSCNR
jgi:hypothetical protein